MSTPHPDDEIVRLAEARNPQEAYIWRDALQDEGIDARVVGDLLAGGFGELNPTYPEVWVHKKDLEKARQLLEAHKTTGLAPEQDE
jgi:hypothetical protein